MSAERRGHRGRLPRDVGKQCVQPSQLFLLSEPNKRAFLERGSVQLDRATLLQSNARKSLSGDPAPVLLELR
jgi:hypothetical protein